MTDKAIASAQWLGQDQGRDRVNFMGFSIAKRGITRDLYLLTAAKLMVLGVIYLALFAPFANRADDTVSHLLGPASHITAQGGS